MEGHTLTQIELEFRNIKHIVCYSGGHSSALVALNVAKRYGTADLILLNHDINSFVEHQDIKRFKQEVADYLQVPITYANHPKWDTMDQFDVSVNTKSFKGATGMAICTSLLKTKPFNDYLKANFPNKDCVIYYGFDKNEMHRVQRRASILGEQGYKSDYPLALWKELPVTKTADIGIKPPLAYTQFKHANCTGCLKAGKQHWYIVYCIRPDIFEKAKAAEDEIGYSIMKNDYLEELEPMFAKMKELGIEATEHEDARTFFARVKKQIASYEDEDVAKPCECTF
jgi:hypothetical protein